MVNELRDIPDISENEPRMPMREPSWNDANESLKCERLRQHVKNLERRLDILQNVIFALEKHVHDLNGNITVPLKVVKEMDNIQPLKRSNGNEVF